MSSIYSKEKSHCTLLYNYYFFAATDIRFTLLSGFCHCARQKSGRFGLERKLSHLGCSVKISRGGNEDTEPGTRDGEGTKHGNIISQQYSRTLCWGSESSLEVALWKSSCYEQLPCGAVTDVFWCVGTPNSTILCRHLGFFDFPKTFCTVLGHKESKSFNSNTGRKTREIDDSFQWL